MKNKREYLKAAWPDMVVYHTVSPVPPSRAGNMLRGGADKHTCPTGNTWGGAEIRWLCSFHHFQLWALQTGLERLGAIPLAGASGENTLVLCLFLSPRFASPNLPPFFGHSCNLVYYRLFLALILIFLKNTALKYHSCLWLLSFWYPLKFCSQSGCLPHLTLTLAPYRNLRRA